MSFFPDVLDPDTQTITCAGFRRKMMELRGIGWIREKGSDSQRLELCGDIQVPGQEGCQEKPVLDGRIDNGGAGVERVIRCGQNEFFGLSRVYGVFNGEKHGPVAIQNVDLKGSGGCTDTCR